MVAISFIRAFIALNLALTISASYLPRAAKGTQFITGPCQSDSDCASGCCGFKSGKCAGPVVAQERDGGCGFGDAQPNANAAKAFGFTGSPPAASPAASPTSGAPAAKGKGTQFITGACQSDSDCASGCCGFKSGKCAGPVVAQERDGGCGFGDAQPNANAAKAFGFTGSPPAASPAASPTSGAPAAKGNGTQFITGPCQSDSDCASGCCGFKSGKCAGPVVAQERDGGCGFGDAQPNANAAQKFRGVR